MADVDLKPVYLITGNDRPKVDVALRRLRGHFDPGSVDRFASFDTDGQTVVATCNAGTLLGGRRLVIVDEVDGRPGEWGRMRETWKAADLEAVLAYVASPAPDTVLCLVGRAVKKDAPLAKAVAKAGLVLDLTIDARKPAAWALARFRERGAKVDPAACELLVELLGDDLHALAQEVDRLALWSGGDETVGEAEVASSVLPIRESPSWELTDAWGRRDARGALRAVETALERSSRPKRDEVARLSSTLASHLGRLRKARAVVDAGGRAGDLASSLKLKPFPAEKLYRQAERFSASELDEAAVTLAALDRALKGGSRLAPELELQRAVAALSGESSLRAR
ncbi:MAG: DNA polymerase III subunit delta [Thermoleophilia bacterium]|nr:DNA polymerase III subunit delta [Thermoleophilia bacterium]